MYDGYATLARTILVLKVVGGISGLVFLSSLIMLFFKGKRKRGLILLVVSAIVSIICGWLQDQILRM
jgi:hypothetical protein